MLTRRLLVVFFVGTFRSDLAIARDIMRETGSLRKVYETVDSYQALKFAQFGASYGRQRSEPPEVYWFYGSTGTGKTREAYRRAPDAYFTTSSLAWWCGYDGHEDVIVDDFRSSFCRLEYLLRLLDRYPFQVAIKGGHRQFLAKRIFITSAFSPRELFAGGADNVDQLLRRITECVHFSELGKSICKNGEGDLALSVPNPDGDKPVVGGESYKPK